MININDVNNYNKKTDIFFRYATTIDYPHTSFTSS